MKRYASAERAGSTHHVGALITGSVGILILTGVLVSVVIPQIQNSVNQQNNTLNFTTTDTFRQTAASVAEFTALRNTTTTLTLNTDFRVFATNNTVQLLQTGTTNLANCVQGGGSANCNYFATYFSLNAQSRGIVGSVPVLMALVLLVAVATLILSTVSGKR